MVVLIRAVLEKMQWEILAMIKDIKKPKKKKDQETKEGIILVGSYQRIG